jgi:hypothetical protein
VAFINSSEAQPQADKACGMSATLIPVILSAAKDLMAVANGIPLETA